MRTLTQKRSLRYRAWLFTWLFVGNFTGWIIGLLLDMPIWVSLILGGNSGHFFIEMEQAWRNTR